MRDEGRDVDEVAGAGLGDELELVAPVLALGWMTTVPAQSFSAPARAWVMAAARFMPGVCGVLLSSSSEWTTRTTSYFHLGLRSVIAGLRVCAPRGAAGSRRRGRRARARRG